MEFGLLIFFSIAVLSGFSTVSAQSFCRRYGLTSDQLLKGRGRADFEDGTYWEQVIDGPLRFVRLNFNRTVDLYKVTVQMRVNPDIRVITYDEHGNLRGRFYQVQAGKRIPLETTLPEQPPISKLMLQGFDAQLTFDEVLYVNVTVCAHNCRAVPGCFGECTPIEKDFGCFECQCPEGSPSSGCSGLQEQDMPRLIEITRKKTANCEIALGYKRMVKTALAIDDCVSFSYPKCDFYRGVIVPKTRAECLKYCY